MEGSGLGLSEYMANRNKKRSIALVVWCGTCLGSVVVDIDHLASIVLKAPALWSVLHQPVFTMFFVGLALASAIGLLASVVLISGDYSDS